MRTLYWDRVHLWPECVGGSSFRLWSIEDCFVGRGLDRKV